MKEISASSEKIRKSSGTAAAYGHQKSHTIPSPISRIPETGSAAQPASCSMRHPPSRLPPSRNNTEQTKVAMAAGTSASPARLALRPALRLFRESVRLKVSTSGRLRERAAPGNNSAQSAGAPRGVCSGPVGRQAGESPEGFSLQSPVTAGRLALLRSRDIPHFAI